MRGGQIQAGKKPAAERQQREEPRDLAPRPDTAGCWYIATACNCAEWHSSTWLVLCNTRVFRCKRGGRRGEAGALGQRGGRSEKGPLTETDPEREREREGIRLGKFRPPCCWKAKRQRCSGTRTLCQIFLGNVVPTH